MVVLSVLSLHPGQRLLDHPELRVILSQLLNLGRVWQLGMRPCVAEVRGGRVCWYRYPLHRVSHLYDTDLLR